MIVLSKSDGIVSKPRSNSLKCFNMTEDHKLSLLRERSRVLGKISLENDKSWRVRPSTVFVSLPARLVTHEAASPTAVSPTFELGYPSRERITTADALLEALTETGMPAKTFNPRNAAMAVERVDTLDSSSPATDSGDDQQDSITTGRLSTFAEGDLIVGRLGSKVRTTRSIGDKYGPRGLTSIPEMSAVTIPPGESARFILASRALWDSIPEDVVEKAVKTICSAQECAAFLGQVLEKNLGSAWHVVVVDVGPFIAAVDENDDCGCVVG
jgi:hypothetical protein